MTTIRAHYDGKVIVPDEPMDLPEGQALFIDIRPMTGSDYQKLSIEERVRRLRAAAGGISAPPLPNTMSRADNFYDERE